MSEWEDLSPTARLYIRRIVRELGAGFTGTIRLECNQGGVRDFHETRKIGTATAQESLSGDATGLTAA